MVTVHKVPAHCFISGNEFADRLAVRGASCKGLHTPDLSHSPPDGLEVCFQSNGRLDTLHKPLYSKFLDRHNKKLMKECRRVKLVFRRYSTIFRTWRGEDTIRALLGFPTPSGHFFLPLARGITGLLGSFITDLETRSDIVRSNKFLQSNQCLSGGKIISKSMVGRFALVHWTGCKFYDGLPRYLYSKCSDEERNPLGFYFKWLQYEGEDQTDKTLYPDTAWNITWLPSALSDDQIKTLERLNYLPGITRPI